MGPIAEMLIPFGLILGRVTGLLFMLPVFSIEVMPRQVRGGLAAVLSIALAASIPMATPENVALALMLEILLGTMMGFVVRLSLVAMEVAGEVTGMQMGFGFAQLTDPMTREVKGPLTQLFLLGGGAMFVATGAHIEVFRALAGSFLTVPPGSLMETSSGWLHSTVGKMSKVFVAGLRIGAPLILVAFASHISFGLLTRVAPQLNVWALGFLFTIGTGLLGAAIFAPVIAVELRNLVEAGVNELSAMVVP